MRIKATSACLATALIFSALWSTPRAMIRGVATNLAFLENVISHPRFRDMSYTTRFIDETPELTVAVRRRDRATKLLNYIADVTVNGSVGVGSVSFADREDAGPGAELRVNQDLGDDGVRSGRLLVLDLEAGAGNVEVHRG